MGRHQKALQLTTKTKTCDQQCGILLSGYELFAKRSVKTRLDYLKQIDYGNADPSTSNGDYWIDGNLAIAAQEQIAFLGSSIITVALSGRTSALGQGPHDCGSRSQLDTARKDGLGRPHGLVGRMG